MHFTERNMIANIHRTSTAMMLSQPMREEERERIASLRTLTLYHLSKALGQRVTDPPEWTIYSWISLPHNTKPESLAAELESYYL